MKKSSLIIHFIIAAIIAVFISAMNVYLLNDYEPLMLYVMFIVGLSLFVLFFSILMHIEFCIKKVSNKDDRSNMLLCIDGVFLIESFILSYYTASSPTSRISGDVQHVLWIISFISLFGLFIFGFLATSSAKKNNKDKK